MDFERKNEKMYFRKGEIRPYVLINTVQRGKILEVNEEEETYTIEDLETKKIHIVDQEDVFIGDD